MPVFGKRVKSLLRRLVLVALQASQLLPTFASWFPTRRKKLPKCTNEAWQKTAERLQKLPTHR